MMPCMKFRHIFHFSIINSKDLIYGLLLSLILLLTACSNDVEQDNNNKMPYKKSLIEFNSKVINRADTSDLAIIKQKKI